MPTAQVCFLEVSKEETRGRKSLSRTLRENNLTHIGQVCYWSLGDRLGPLQLTLMLKTDVTLYTPTP